MSLLARRYSPLLHNSQTVAPAKADAQVLVSFAEVYRNASTNVGAEFGKPATASYFLLLRQKKVTKEKATSLAARLVLRTHALPCSLIASGATKNSHDRTVTSNGIVNFTPQQLPWLPAPGRKIYEKTLDRTVLCYDLKFGPESIATGLKLFTGGGNGLNQTAKEIQNTVVRNWLTNAPPKIAIEAAERVSERADAHPLKLLNLWAG